MKAKTISISIGRGWQDVYEAIWRPDAFPTWASGLSRSTLTRSGERWRATGPEGDVEITFTDHNPFGVMDHWVTLSDGQRIYVPMRVIENGDGAEVCLTLFQVPGMTDEKFDQDAAWVERDLAALRALLERGGTPRA